MRGETAGKPLKYAGNGDFRRGTEARIINILEMRMRRRRSALFLRSRGRTTAAARRGAHIRRIRKSPGNARITAFLRPLGPVPEVTAADQEDESFAAHAAIVADAAADCKRGKRANGALERANFRENGAFRRGSVGIRACAGRARRARRGGEPGQNRRRAILHFGQNRFTTNSKQRKKSSGSTLGFSVLGGAAFCYGAAVVIRPVNRLFFPFDVLSIFEMNEVKNVLLLLLRQEAIHGDQIGFLVLQRRTVAGQTLFLLEVLESRIAVILLRSLRTATPKDEIVQRDL